MSDRRIALTVGPYTTPLIEGLTQSLDALGIAWQTYPASGDGGLSLEADIHAGKFTGVIDATLTELANHLFNGVEDAGQNRMTAAAIVGIPQLLVLGGLDIVMQPTPRRTTPEENDKLGLDIAQKACAARGLTTIIIPLRGLSSLDVVGVDWHDPAANDALIQSIYNWIYQDIKLIEVDAHINDEECIHAIIEQCKMMFSA